jgi:hypothetical protein
MRDIDSTLEALARPPFRARLDLRGRDAATVELRHPVFVAALTDDLSPSIRS